MFFRVTLTDNTLAVVNSQFIEHMYVTDEGHDERIMLSFGEEHWLPVKLGTINKITDALSREGQFLNVEIAK